MPPAASPNKPKSRKKTGPRQVPPAPPKAEKPEQRLETLVALKAQKQGQNRNTPAEPKAEKPGARRDAFAELKAEMRAKNTMVNPKSPISGPATDAKKGETPAAHCMHLPDPTEWSALLLRIAEHSQQLTQDFLEKNKTLAASFPPQDSAHLGQAFLELMERLINKPDLFVDPQMAFWQDYVRLCETTFSRMVGQDVEPVITPSNGDKRFQNKDWQDIWLFDFIKQSYLLTARFAQCLVKKADGLDIKTARKIDFYTRQMVDAIAPTNFWLTNPEVLRTTIESGGENLIKGFEHLMSDLERGHGELLISMSDNKAFHYGQNIASTPGKIIFQNKLFQLIQYAPTTEKVHKTPLLILPPWINKYYILDLREKNSLMRWLVEQGHTVFCISWANPDESFADTDFDDYMESGLLAAMKEVKRTTSEDKVNVVGYCIGGTLLASTLAYLKAAKKQQKDLPEIASATYFVALTDFADPGEVGVFIDEAQITALEAAMAVKGYLSAQALQTTFNLLRANDLIWSFVVNNYLLGKEPFPFDLLTWNSDSTNLPAKMHSFYLRNMYLNNKLVQPRGIAMKGVPIDLRDITTPSFLISAQDDHIAPWRSTYAATQLYKGPVTFVLAKSGHIAGVVNPPAANKYGYFTNAKCPPHPDDWLKAAKSHEGSWWPAWMEWLSPYAGEMVPARKPANAIEDAPGSYVRVRAI